MNRTLTYLCITVSLALVFVLGACSHSAPKDAAAAASGTGAATPAAPVPTSFGARADSLNGMQGHTFGEPVRAFTRLRLYANQTPPLTAYFRDLGQESGWFGKHTSTEYDFLDGQFVRFSASALNNNRPLLLAHAQYLFGPGQRLDDQHYLWEGQRVRAEYWLNERSPERPAVLTVTTQAGIARLAAAQKARQAAEDAAPIQR